MSRTGANIFSGKIDLDSSEVNMADTDVLFAGFISAILSVSEELQNSDIRELGYQENKIIFTLTDNLIFLGFADTRVPNSDVQSLLDEIVRRWMEDYEDMEYPYVPNDMRDNILKIIQSSIRDVFWWASPTYNLDNNLKFVKSMFSKPGSSYFIQYLPKIYLLTGLIMLGITMGATFGFGTVFNGFAGGVPVSSNDESKAFYTSATTILLFVFGIGIMMKIMFRDDYKFFASVNILMIYSVVLLGSIISLSYIYRAGFLGPIFTAVGDNLLLNFLTEMFLFSAPLNIGLFGYILLSAYAGSNNSTISTINYLVGFLLSTLVMISISQFIATAVYVVNWR